MVAFFAFVAGAPFVVVQVLGRADPGDLQEMRTADRAGRHDDVARRRRNERAIADTAFRNSTLQGAYLIIAARALGLDAGPMSGFDNDTVDAAFFAGSTVKSNFLVNLGYGDASRLHPRSPRFTFDEAARIA